MQHFILDFGFWFLEEVMAPSVRSRSPKPSGRKANGAKAGVSPSVHDTSTGGAISMFLRFVFFFKC